MTHPGRGRHPGRRARHRPALLRVHPGGARSTRPSRPCWGPRTGGGQGLLHPPDDEAGLYRYHISDLVRVTGFFDQTPLVEFLGKGHRFANLTGEKLSEYHVTQAMDAVAAATGQPLTAYSLAPCWDDAQPYYGLFLEEPDAADAALLRRFLADARPGAGRAEHRVRGEADERPAGPGAGARAAGGLLGAVGPRAAGADGRVAGAVQAPVPDRRRGVRPDGAGAGRAGRRRESKPTAVRPLGGVSQRA